MRIRLVLASVFAIFSIASQGSGIRAEHIETQIDGDRERVETGVWIQDDVGRSRFDIDDWTQIHDPIKGVVWRANSRRGKYSEKRIRLTTPPMGSPLIDIPGSLNGANSREVTRTALGTRSVNDVQCEGVFVELAISGKGVRENIELEAWMTEEFNFPFNVIFIVRSNGGEQRTELRNIVEMAEHQLKGVFEPDENWKKSRFPLVRTNVQWTGFWPFAKPGSKVTGSILPLPMSREQKVDPRDAGINKSR